MYHCCNVAYASHMPTQLANLACNQLTLTRSTQCRCNSRALQMCYIIATTLTKRKRSSAAADDTAASKGDASSDASAHGHHSDVKHGVGGVVHGAVRILAGGVAPDLAHRHHRLALPPLAACAEPANRHM